MVADTLAVVGTKERLRRRVRHARRGAGRSDWVATALVVALALVTMVLAWRALAS